MSLTGSVDPAARPDWLIPLGHPAVARLARASGEPGVGDARRHAQRLGLWVALAGQAGSTADEDFPGLAALVSPGSGVTARLPDGHEGTLTVDVPL